MVMTDKMANIVILINHNGMHNHKVSVKIRENIPTLTKIKHTTNNCIFSGTEISSSEEFDQMHIFVCGTLQQEAKS